MSNYSVTALARVVLLLGVCLSCTCAISFWKGKQKPINGPMWNNQRINDMGNSMNHWNSAGQEYNTAGPSSGPSRPGPKLDSEMNDNGYGTGSNTEASSKSGSSNTQYGGSSGSYGNSYGNHASSFGNPVSAASTGYTSKNGGGGGYGNGGYGDSYGNKKDDSPFNPDTLSFLSSLAPSLLLSSLLLPLAISTLLAASNTTLFGRKRREVGEDLFPIFDEDFQIDDSDLDSVFQKTKIQKNDYVFQLLDSLEIDADPEVQNQNLETFVQNNSLADESNHCLEKLACLNAVEDLEPSLANKLQTVVEFLDKSDKLQDRINKASAKGESDEESCKNFVCEERTN